MIVLLSMVSASMLVGSVRRILHDANVHRLGNRYPNRFSCVVIDEARRTFEEAIARVLEDIELAKRLQRVVAALLHPGRALHPPPPRQPQPHPPASAAALSSPAERVQP